MILVSTLVGHTPGDACRLSDSSVAIADMVDGVIRSVGDGPATSVRAVDVRSCASSRGGCITAGGFSNELLHIGPAGAAPMRSNLAVPTWVDTLGERVAVAESGARRIRFLGADAISDIVLPVPTANVSTVVLDEDGAAWVAARPAPGLWRIESTGRATAFAPPSSAPMGELTGLTRHHSGRGLVLFDRTNGCFWSFERTAGFMRLKSPAVPMVRPRALRSHTAGPWAYSFTDPPAGAIHWFDEALRVRETWTADRVDRSLVMRVPIGEGRGYVELRDSALVHSSRAVSSPHLLVGATPRDLRLLPDGTMLVAHRDRHVVSRRDARGRTRGTYRAPGLAYPCSAEHHPVLDEVWVLSPYRHELVRFRLDGRCVGRVSLTTTYPRWVRIARDGTVLVLDAGRRLALMGGGVSATGWSELPLPAALAPELVRSVEWSSVRQRFVIENGSATWSLSSGGFELDEVVTSA